MPQYRAALLAPLLLIWSLWQGGPLPDRSKQVTAPRTQSIPVSLRPNIHVRHVLNAGSALPSVRIAKDPRDNTLYYLKQNGDIYRVNMPTGTSTLLYSAAAHGLSNTQGFAIGPTGTIYLVGNQDRPNTQTRATIVRGVLDTLGQRKWVVLAQTADYPRSNTAFDHRFNGIVASPTGDYVYIASGSRTDHGEVQSAGGLYPNTREVGLTACIFRLPAHGQNIVLPNDRAALKNAGYIFAEGTRNTFDMAFAPGGELFGAENGPDRDMPDELNWLRAGQHYGFPWRIGGQDNPQQYPGYDPVADRLLDPRFTAVKGGFYHNDPTFPARPAISLIEPVVNQGPDADSYRDPQDGQIKDASALSRTLSTFTTHRSPLGLVFDTAGAMAGEFQRSGFITSWTPGDPEGASVPGPFKDPSQDLLHLTLVKTDSGSYTAHIKRIVKGFNNPIDAEVIGNNIYVLEYGGSGGLWEISLPSANLLQNASFEKTGIGWRAPWTVRTELGGTFTQDGTTKVHGDFAIKAGIPQASTSVWLVQLRQKGVPLIAGRTYSITFWAKASQPRTFDIVLQQAAPPYAIYFRKWLSLTTEWQQYRMGYTATASDTDVSFNINLAHAMGQVWLDHASIVEVR